MATTTTTEVVYRAGFSCPVDPDIAHAELETIRAENCGVLLAATVVDASRPEDAPLHPVFTWDDFAAAEQWRQDEARRLIRNVCVVQQTDDGEDEGEARPVYIHTRPLTGRDEGGYQPVALVMSDTETRAAAIADALAQLRGWQKRYGWIAELAGLSNEIKKLSNRQGAA